MAASYIISECDAIRCTTIGMTNRNAPQPHGAFQDGTLVWSFVSRSAALQAFGIPRNGVGTKAALAKLQSTGQLMITDRVLVRAISFETFKSHKQDFTLEEVIITALQKGESIGPANLEESIRRCAGPCARTLVWNNKNFSQEGELLRSVCRKCRLQICEIRTTRFKERLKTKSTFICNKCHEELPIAESAKDRSICQKCLHRQRLETHRENRPDNTSPPTECASCQRPFDSDNFSWRPELGQWRSLCNVCSTYRYDCAMCPTFKVPTPGALCYVDRVGLARTKKFEEEMCTFLTGCGYIWSYQDRAIPCSPKDALVRPDFLFVHQKFLTVLEVDEHYHRHYDVSCELKRIEKLHENGGRSLYLIRFNPQSRAYGQLREVLDRAFCTETEETTRSLEASGGVEMVFIGYPQKKVDELKSAMVADVGVFFPYTILM